MKLGLYADPHFSQTSSIIVGRKGEFSGRLDNLINSFAWMNKLFKDEGVDEVICLGDLTDKPVLTSEEITAMSRCGIEGHHLIVGNHCRADKDGQINSIANYENVYNEPQSFGKDVFILPYNHDTFDLSSLERKPKIILSHNDLKGYDFGGHISTEGYDIQDILDNCDLFINGHLHNGGWVVKDRIMNLGSLSGMNFASCGGQWEPSVAIVDTETLEIKLYENPEAYKFKKEEFSTLTKLKGFLDNLEGLHYVVQIKVPDSIAQKARKLIDQCEKVDASRLLTYKKKTTSKTSQTKKLSNLEVVSVYDKLRKYVDEKKPDYSLDTLGKIIDKIASTEEGVE